MLDKRQRPMTPEEFYSWQERMDERYELVDGFPVKRSRDIELMTGASRRHDQIVWNVLAALKPALRGKPCRGFTADTAVKTVQGTRRRPDAGIKCGRRDDQSFEAGDVRVIFEVLSPSTHELDMFGKLDEYRALPTVRHVVLIEPNAAHVIMWSRNDDLGWTNETLEGLDATLRLGSLDVVLKLSDFYDDVDFRPAPKLVDGSEH